MRLLTLMLVAVAWPSAAPALEDPDLEIAKRHFQRGTRAYDVRDYEGALSEFRAAKEVHPAPAFDYNIGRCLDRLERVEEAIHSYEAFIAAAVDPAETASARERVQALRERLARRRPAGVSRRGLAASITLGVTALVAAGVGAGLVASVPGPLDELHRTGCDQPCAELEMIKARAYAGYAMFGVAGAVAVADLVVIGLTVRRSREPRRAALRWSGGL